MEWLEFIRLSTSAECARQLTPALADMARDLRQAPGVTNCAVMQHALYDGHVAVALMHHDPASARQTKDALAVADHLRNYGMVDHQVWLLVGPDGLCPAARQEPTPPAAAPPDGNPGEPGPPPRQH